MRTSSHFCICRTEPEQECYTLHHTIPHRLYDSIHLEYPPSTDQSDHRTPSCLPSYIKPHPTLVVYPDNALSAVHHTPHLHSTIATSLQAFPKGPYYLWTFLAASKYKLSSFDCLELVSFICLTSIVGLRLSSFNYFQGFELISLNYKETMQ